MSGPLLVTDRQTEVSKDRIRTAGARSMRCSLCQAQVRRPRFDPEEAQTMLLRSAPLPASRERPHTLTCSYARLDASDRGDRGRP